MKKGIVFIFVTAFLLSLLFVTPTFALNACCERTDNGEWCQYTDESECDSSYLSTYASCEQTSYCQVGTCYSSDSGSCYANTPRATCEAEEGTTWTSDAIDDVPQCQLGCCVIGDQAFFVTEVQCKSVGSEYEDAAVSFDDSIETEGACLDSVKNLDFGCCVDGDSYTFTTRESCASAGEEEVGTNFTEQGFHEDMLCSNDLLSSGCAKQQTTECYQGKVYWVDSCGNRENIYSTDERASYNEGYALAEQDSCTVSGANDASCGNCDYAGGSLCGDDVNGVMDVGEFTCVDLNCESTFQNDASPLSGSDRLNGESWCIYDSHTGEALDTVGSRQYRHLCLQGEEVTEECADFREEVCLSGVLTEDVLGTLDALHLSDASSYVEAACRDNRYETCQACNDEEGLTARNDCCTDEDQRDCYWMESGLETDESLEEELPEGICVPQVPPGLQFWSDDGQGDGVATSTTCDVASTTCTVTYRISGVTRLLGGADNPDKWDIISESPDGCASRDWFVDQNTLCRAQADCGAYFNYIGEPGYDGFVSTMFDEEFFLPLAEENDEFTEEDLGDWDYLASVDEIDESKTPFLSFHSASAWRNPATYIAVISAVAGGIANAKNGECAEATVPPVTSPSVEETNEAARTRVLACTEKYRSMYDFCSSEPDLEVCNAQVEILYSQCIAEQKTAPEFSEQAPAVPRRGPVEDLGQKAAGAAEGKIFSQIFDNAGCFVSGVIPLPIKILGGKEKAPFTKWMNWVTFVTTAYLVVDYANDNETTIAYNVDCRFWQPPEGGDNCELCNNADMPCSEYRCRSLGASCDLVNEGTGNETCISLFVNDVNSPLIEPAEGLISDDLTIREGTEEGARGFEVQELIPAFTNVQLGIQTDEPAVCKYSAEPSAEYDTMNNYFGSELYLYNHSILFSLGDEVTQEEIVALNQGIYTIYVRCSDVQGNANEADYFIRFTVDTTPDLTPPEVVYTSIEDGAYMAYQLDETAFSLWTNEPATCHWNNNDTAYEFMGNTMDCADSGYQQSSIYYGAYECSTTLAGVTDDEENKFYFRCEDQSGNMNEDSFVFTTRASESELDITSVSPENVIYDADVTLEVETDGGAENGKALCAYSTEDVGYNSMIKFANSNDTVHTQSLILVPGDYTYYFVCQDIAGNQASNSTSFSVDVDTTGPTIENFYADAAYAVLVLEMDEASSCEYASDTFSFGEGTEMTGANTTMHKASLDMYYYDVICEDSYGNQGSYFLDLSTWV